MSGATAKRPTFQSVEIDLMDQRLEEQAAEKGIPVLITPKPDGIVSVEAGEPPERPQPAAQTPSAKPRRSASAQATPRARMKTLNLEIPDYVWIEIKMRAAREMVSVRHIIMTALKADGIEIREADMVEDGRRLRGGDSI